MIRSQGKYFSEHELKRISMLLRESDMTLSEIADRMRCSRSAVAAVNRRFQIRSYEGRRSHWRLVCIAPLQPEESADTLPGLIPSDQMVPNES
jgi:hypothetical protein